MNIISVKTKKDKKRYIDFIYKLYKNDKNYCDLNISFVKNFLYKKDSYAKRVDVQPIIIEDDGIKLVGMYISSDDSKELKLSFLEFVPNARKYIEAIIAYGKNILNNKNLDKIVVGINGQVSYGLGILEHGKNEKFEFNSNYNLKYYVEELDKMIASRKNAYSYIYNAQNSLSYIDNNLIKELNKQYTFRYMNKRKFKNDMLIFGNLCDKTLKSTPYYSYKSKEEMYELMKQMKFLLKNEDIIFALKDGREIGFVFTHPDYVELFDKPKMNYIKIFLRSLYKRPKNLIYNVIGVLPEYQQSGIAMGLIYESIKMRQKHYPVGVSSFILEDNIPSTMLCRKLSVGINKKYKIYEIKKDDLNV